MIGGITNVGLGKCGVLRFVVCVVSFRFVLCCVSRFVAGMNNPLPLPPLSEMMCFVVFVLHFVARGLSPPTASPKRPAEKQNK